MQRIRFFEQTLHVGAYNKVRCGTARHNVGISPPDGPLGNK